MCGICGIIGSNNDRDIILKNMKRRIKHRGPDDSGSYMDESAALGFQRLSIIDLDHGMQPMKNETDDKIIVFNGEIYNHRKLRDELVQKDHLFSNHSDTECILHGYEEYGTAIVQRLRGMFAFAIWDTKAQTLFAARDMFGIKPFYYAMIEGCFVFSSEIKSILEFPGYTKEVNHDALEQYLSFQYSVLPETFFKGIYRLEPGHMLIYHDGILEIKEYWDFSFDYKKHCLHQSSEHLNKVMGNSINAHMVSDVEVGSLLSSGIDSSYIVKRFGGNKTFTVGFFEKNSPYNEYSHIERFLETVPKDSYYKEITPDEYWDALPKAMYYMDEPLADASAVALYLLDKEAASQVKVVLSGEGADELFGGYEIYQEPKALRIFDGLPKNFRKQLGHSAAKLPPKLKGRNYLIRGSKTVEERFIGNANIFQKHEKQALLKDYDGSLTTQKFIQKYYDRVADMDDISKMQYIDIKLWLPGDILLKADKMSMAHSLETRVPFLDKKVCNFARTIPPKYKLRNGKTKYIFRDAASKYLPEATANKKKLGFPIPIRVWLKQDVYYTKIRKAFESPQASEFFNTKYLVDLLDTHRSGAEDYSRKIWTIYTFLVWYDVYFTNEGNWASS